MQDLCESWARAVVNTHSTRVWQMASCVNLLVLHVEAKLKLILSAAGLTAKKVRGHSLSSANYA